MAKTRVVVLGAGFGGLELTTILSEALGEALELTLIDKSDAFIFGFSKLDVMFGRQTPDAVRLPYRHIVKPGVRFRQEAITGIDPEARRVTTDGGTYDADVLVVALGADYDVAATPGLAEGGHEFYSMAGATRLRDVLPTFSKGHAIVGVTSAPFKCPPAPSEAALLLHDHLVTRGVREACEISLVIPFGAPVPPSPDTSRALVAAFAERNITFVPNRLVRTLDPDRRVAILDDGTEMKYRAVPRRAEASGARCGGGEWHDRERVDSGQPEDARDPVPQCVCGGRRDKCGRPQGRRVRRGRGARGRRLDHRGAARQRAAGPLRRRGRVLYRVRRQPHRTR